MGLFRPLKHEQRIDAYVEPRRGKTALRDRRTRRNAAQWRTMGLFRPLKHEQRIDAYVEPIHPPVQMRPRRPPRGAHRTNRLTLHHTIAYTHIDPRQMQEVR